jgi:hypothetical protein
MYREIDSIMNGKPDCFAICQEFSTQKLRCIRCRSNEQCTMAIMQMIDAIRSNRIPSARDNVELVDQCPDIVDLLDDPSVPSPGAWTYETIEELVKRSTHYGPSKYPPAEADLRWLKKTPPVAPSEWDLERERELDALFASLEDCGNADASESSISSDQEKVALADVSAIEDLAIHRLEAADSLLVGTKSVATAIDTSPEVMRVILESMASGRHRYGFPLPSARAYDTFSNRELTDELSKLLHAAFQSNPATGYYSIRQELCAIHIEMNLRQQHAPRFRPQHLLCKHFDTVERSDEALDRQVIDLHWRAHSSNKPVSHINNYPGIFESAPFDLRAAEQFAQEKWKAAAKVVHLHLSEDMQWENAILQGGSLQKKWTILARGHVIGSAVKQVGRPQIEMKLREAMAKGNKRELMKHIPGMLDAWVGREMIGNNPAEVARIVALMTGEPPRDRNAMKRTLQSIDDNLALLSKAKKLA